MSRHTDDGGDAAADFVPIVREFVDAVFECAADEYGDRRTPLLVDAVDVETGQEATGRKAGETWSTGAPEPSRADAAASNFAHQQNFLRTLVALSAVTGDDEYRERAAELVRFAFDELTGDNGLLHWGGHVAYDLRADEPIYPTDKSLVHELKFHYPYYEFLWEVDPDATRRHVESMWNAHVLDWATLDFNRHGAYDIETGTVWDNTFEGGDVFFLGEGRTFENTGSDLYYAAGALAALADEDDPLRWAERLEGRYAATRQGLGITGYTFSSREDDWNDDYTTSDRAHYQLDPYIHGDHLTLEGTLFQPHPCVQRRQLVLGERLGDRGDAFTETALTELRGWAEAAYRPEENEFEPMLTDGYTLDGFLLRRDGYYGDVGTVIRPIEGHPDFLWAYTQAYRVTGDAFFWTTARDLASGNGVGDIGPAGGGAPSLAPGTDHDDYHTVYGLLELYRATGTDAYRQQAARVARNLVAARRHEDTGLFVTRRDERTALVGAHEPLALLHVAAAGRETPRPPYPGRAAYGAGTGASGGI